MGAQEDKVVRFRLFALGRVVATRGVIDSLSIAEISNLLDRHVSGDWGELDAHDTRANESALKYGARILSSYILSRHDGDQKVWIITEADRSATTVLLPQEY